jgi:GTP-binding protein
MKKIEFIKPVYNLNELPKDKYPTLVLCGRSNVGKSTFLNSIFNSKIAHTSSFPGKTRSLNYYLAESNFYIVDLPGFGYAKVSKKERNEWQELIEKYFFLNEHIRMVIHLVDCRHEPTDLDLELNEYLYEKNIPSFIILNKSDKLNQSDLAHARKRLVQLLPERIYGENFLFYSSIKSTGKKEIIKLISSLFLS